MPSIPSMPSTLGSGITSYMRVQKINELVHRGGGSPRKRRRRKLPAGFRAKLQTNRRIKIRKALKLS